MSDSESEGLSDGVVSIVERLVHGCEKFVVDRLEEEKEKAVKFETSMKDECGKIRQTSMENIERAKGVFTSELKRLEGQFKVSQKKLQNALEEKEKIIQANKSQLEALNVQIANQEKHCKCKELYLGYVKAGSQVFGQDVMVNIDTEPPSTKSCSMESKREICPPLFPIETFYATPVASEPVLGDVASDSAGKIQLKMTDYQTPELNVLQDKPVYKSLDELPGVLKEQIQKYYRETTLASNEKLSCLQKAYLRWFIDTCAKDKGIPDRAVMLRMQGISDGIWSRTFCPSGSKDLVLYLKQRIKNELMQKRLAGLRNLSATQESRLKKMKVQHEKKMVLE